MGSTFKQKSGKWGIRFDVPEDGKRKQKQIGGFSKKTEAERELKKIEADILNGEFFQSASLTVSEYVQLWLNNFVQPNRAPKTLEFYTHLYNKHFKEYFKYKPLSCLKAYDIDMFYKHLHNTTSLSANSIHHCHKTLRAALNQAVRWGYLKETPMTKVTAPKQEKAKSSYWPPDVIPAGLAYLKGERIEWIARMAVLTGMRVGEICALNIRNVDFEHHLLKIEETAQRIKGKGVTLKPPKTEGSQDVIPMTCDVEAIIHTQIRKITENKKQMLAAGKQYSRLYDGYLALWEDGKIIDPNYVSKRFRQILERQDEVERITFHDLRHSCASWLIYNGVELKTIQLILRHVNFKVTADTYSHVSQSAKLDALNTLMLPK